jgi:hypothetical protein
VDAQVTLPSRQLLAFGFAAGAAFEGQLVGAIERLESGGALRVLDALFVAADEAGGELVAIDLHGGTGGLTAKLLDFRLDPASRSVVSEHARALGEHLEPGSALAMLLVEHVWARTLADAVNRAGGTSLANEFVEVATLSDLPASDFLARVRRAP